MLSALLTLALLPLALAACPCPPAPAAAEICGSNNKTYPSACDLDCTAPPGVAAAHPGPCHPEDATPGRPITAGEEMQKFGDCDNERQCSSAICGECGRDEDCREMCRLKCLCGCLALQTSDLDYGRWEQCVTAAECGWKKNVCYNRYSTQESKYRCWMDEWWCKCGCMQQAANTSRPTSSSPRTSPASTSPATTSPASTSPATTSPASDAVQHMMWERVLLVVCALACVCVCVWVSVRARARHPVLCCPKNFHIVYQLTGSEQCPGAAGRASTTTGVELKSLELNCGPPP